MGMRQNRKLKIIQSRWTILLSFFFKFIRAAGGKNCLFIFHGHEINDLVSCASAVL